ncbi:MAG: hypothetical protein ACREAC_28495, partial [Blastocatellia bacterium]
LEPAFAPGGSSSVTQVLLANVDQSIAELRRFSNPLWSYSSNKIPPEHHSGIHHIEALGLDSTSGAASSISSSISSSIFRHHQGIELIETGWWNRAVHLQIRAGIPLFALTCMNELWGAYSRLPSELRARCHIDRRWVGWPELLPHLFNGEVINLFAQGLAVSQIVRLPGGIFEYRNNSGNGRALGDSFRNAYTALSLDRQLLNMLSNSVAGRAAINIAQEAGDKADELWGLLARDGLPMEDRTVVEALIRCLERIVSRPFFAAAMFGTGD